MKTLFVLLISVFLIGCATENDNSPYVSKVESHINAAGFDPTYPGMSGADLQASYDAGLVKYSQEIIDGAGSVTFKYSDHDEIPVTSAAQAVKLLKGGGMLYTGRVKVYRWGKNSFYAERENIYFESDPDAYGFYGGNNYSGGYQGPTRPSNFPNSGTVEYIGRTKLLDEIIEALRADGAKF